MKQRIAVLFGGKSIEHEVSIVSARAIMNALDPQKYEPVPLALDKNNHWLDLDSSKQYLQTGILAAEFQELNFPLSQVADIFFPVVHGSFGEDGCLQGLLEMQGIPYVGGGVLGSALGMDKEIQKTILRANKIPVVDFLTIHKYEWVKRWLEISDTISVRFLFPLFVKPVNAGSSVGIFKVSSREALLIAVEEAFRYDSKVLVEATVPYARELECAMLGNEEPQASVVGEIKSSNEFYDYDAKYVDGASVSFIPADVTENLASELQEAAVRAYTALEGTGMARVDFLVNGKTGDWVVSEINTIPGFTSISMYPKLWEASGLFYQDLITRLIELAEERFAERNLIKRIYQPKRAWYQQ